VIRVVKEENQKLRWKDGRPDLIGFEESRHGVGTEGETVEDWGTRKKRRERVGM